MRIAITATGSGTDAQVDPRFGRCAYFVFVDTDTLQAETVANNNVDAAGGAGTQSAQIVAEKGVATVLTGNCGPKAFAVLKAAGIKVIIGVSGTVREAVEKYKAGMLSETSGPNAAEKSGVYRPAV